MSWRSKFGGQQWQVAALGMFSRSPEGKVTIHRTRGEPVTIRTYLRHWRTDIEAVSYQTGVPVPIILMTLATENGPAKRGPDGAPIVLPPRKEPKYISDEETPHQISVGPCHVLLSTARTSMKDPSINRAWLTDIRNNMLAAFRQLASWNHRWDHDYDPVLCAAIYNSGGIYDASNPSSRFYNRWHLRSWPGHLDRAVNWYGDAMAVLNERSMDLAPIMFPPHHLNLRTMGRVGKGE